MALLENLIRAILFSAVALMLLTYPALANGYMALLQLEALQVSEESTVSYDRQRDFGGWLTRGGEPICLDVRGRVLAAESISGMMTSIPIGSHCRVTSGLWNDPYTGTQVYNADKIDVDHVVPLKEAWQSGAWRWSQSARRAYANDLTNPDHLLAVSARANRSKGDRDPAGWLPPNPSFLCRYLEIWVQVKTRWKLTADQAEFNAIRNGLQNCP